MLTAIIFRTRKRSEDDYAESPHPSAVWDDTAPRIEEWHDGSGNWTVTFTSLDELQRFVDELTCGVILRHVPENTFWGGSIPAHYSLEIYDYYRE